MWRSLLFGRKYSLVLYRRLMFALLNNSIFDLSILPFTCLDDILVAGGRRELHRVVKRFKAKLSKAKFVVNYKSFLQPTVVLDSIGKVFDTKGIFMYNITGMITGLVRAWLHTLTRPQ